MMDQKPLIALSFVFALSLIVSACGDSEEPVAIEDPSKLSAELEAEAQSIEDRAAIAVREAEALADQELQQLRTEAAAADNAAETPENSEGTEPSAPDNE